MKYRSTRGGENDLSFGDIVFSGMAADGGFYMPETIPSLDEADMDRLSTMSFKELMCEILEMFMGGEISKEELAGIVSEAYEAFPHDEVVPLKILPGDVYMFEAFHGPSMAFKDLGMRILSRLLQFFMKKQSITNITIIVFTSGDTGSAALQAFRDMEGVHVICVLPKGYCNKIQELQMTTILADNITVIRANGSSDDLDEVYYKLWTPELVKKYKLTAVNSVHWGRMCPQITHYFYMYFKMKQLGKDNISIVIPTGGMGNIASGWVAAKMGLPVHLVAAASNDTVERALRTGVFKGLELYLSYAYAMNIAVPYNWERMLYVLTNCDTEYIRTFMDSMQKNGSSDIEPTLLEKIRATMSAHTVQNDGILETIKRCWEEAEYRVCPHTATALSAHYNRPEGVDRAYALFAPASHAKFPEVGEKAGLERVADDRVDCLPSLPQRFEDAETLEECHKKILDTLCKKCTPS